MREGLGHGCSLLFVDGPPRRDLRVPGDPVFCIEDSAWPTVDYVFAALNTAGAITAALSADQFTRDERQTIVVSNGLWAVVQIYSGTKGKSRITECGAAKLEWIRSRTDTTTWQSQ